MEKAWQLQWGMGNAGAKMFAEMLVNLVKKSETISVSAMRSCFRKFRDHYWMEYFATIKNDY